MLKLGESIGDLMEESRKALDDDKVDDAEKEKIADEVLNLEKKIADFKIIEFLARGLNTVKGIQKQTV